jgi:cytochrome c2
LGAGLAILIALWTVLWGLPADAAPLKSRCLTCHGVHYAQQGGCGSCHRGDPRTSRKELAHSGLIRGRYAQFTNPEAPMVRKGKRLAESTACRRCHLLGASGTRLASNLDTVLQGSRPEEIDQAIQNPALFMPQFHFSDHDRAALVTYILAAGLTAGKQAAEPPQVVHFNLLRAGQQPVFAKQCGGCHKLLSERFGGLGSGNDGPNLSGLFTRFYPATFQHDQPWTVERLKRWLKNPRAIRSQTMMRPVTLQPTEWDELLKSIDISEKRP